MTRYISLFRQYITFSSLIEIAILAILIYQVIRWIKNTRAWALFKGIGVILIFSVLVNILDLTTIRWLLTKTLGFAITIVAIVFQPELRTALEQIGRKNIFLSFLGLDRSVEKTGRGPEKVNSELVKAAVEMSKTKTGALIVIERDIHLSEYERTGIPIDAIVTNQLLVNIFEHNTPLHDGAVFIKDDRVVAATCYLPLSDNMELSKELGTRHRAAVGISEVSDSLTIVVSEETGGISIAEGGRLMRNLSPEDLKNKLTSILKFESEETGFKKLKGMIINEKKANK